MNTLINTDISDVGIDKNELKEECLEHTIAIQLGYDGAAFCGFARQQGDIRTVQDELETVLGVYFRRQVETVCAGRTDTGVHARDQYVSFGVTTSELEKIEGFRMIRAMNALLPDDICVGEIYQAAPGFSARFSAQKRIYRYRISIGNRRPLFSEHWVYWHKPSLDIEAMRQGACYLEGKHDFKSFCKTVSAVGKNTVRDVHSIRFFTEDFFGEELICMEIVGNAYLHSMVRTIVGTLVDVGTGRRSIPWVGEVLAACDRRVAGQNAPACGLTLWKVEYNSADLTKL